MSQKSLGNSEIDLKAIFQLISKNKKIFFILSFFCFFLGCIHLYLKETIWQGEFQIIISKQKRSQQ